MLVDAGMLRCSRCEIAFPTFQSGVTSIPWLFDRPSNVLEEWRARYAGFLEANRVEQVRLGAALEEPGLGRLARERITNLLRARQLHTKQVIGLLEPLMGGQLDKPATPELATTKTPQHQGLLSYYSNIFRDWAWNTEERQALFSCFAELLPELEPESDQKPDSVPRLGDARLLTLGAGAGWLPYELHRLLRPRLSVAVDINPLLTAVANRVTQGDGVALYEFPLAPRDGASGAVLQECSAVEPLEGRFFWLLADAINPPFAPQCFDMVFTPWLIDILPEDLKTFLPRLNRLLPVGGLWLNTGTLAFFHAAASWRYSEAELTELIEASGFRICELSHRTVPYLQSPWSGHGRTEQVLSFRAEKVAEVPSSPDFKLLPDCLTSTTVSIPNGDGLAVRASSHLFKAQVLGAIDGSRSISEISALLAQHYQLPLDQAVAAVQRLLVEIHEDSLTGNEWLDS